MKASFRLPSTPALSRPSEIPELPPSKMMSQLYCRAAYSSGTRATMSGARSSVNSTLPPVVSAKYFSNAGMLLVLLFPLMMRIVPSRFAPATVRSHSDCQSPLCPAGAAPEPVCAGAAGLHAAKMMIAITATLWSVRHLLLRTDPPRGYPISRG